MQRVASVAVVAVPADIATVELCSTATTVIAEHLSVTEQPALPGALTLHGSSLQMQFTTLHSRTPSLRAFLKVSSVLNGMLSPVRCSTNSLTALRLAVELCAGTLVATGGIAAGMLPSVGPMYAGSCGKLFRELA